MFSWRLQTQGHFQGWAVTLPFPLGPACCLQLTQSSSSLPPNQQWFGVGPARGKHGGCWLWTVACTTKLSWCWWPWSLWWEVWGHKMNLCLPLSNVPACSACFVKGAFLDHKCENPSDSCVLASMRRWPCHTWVTFSASLLHVPCPYFLACGSPGEKCLPDMSLSQGKGAV